MKLDVSVASARCSSHPRTRTLPTSLRAAARGLSKWLKPVRSRLIRSVNCMRSSLKIDDMLGSLSIEWTLIMSLSILRLTGAT